MSVNPLQRFEEVNEYDVSGNEIKYRTADNRLMTMVRELHVNAALPNDDVGYVG